MSKFLNPDAMAQLSERLSSEDISNEVAPSEDTQSEPKVEARAAENQEVAETDVKAEEQASSTPDNANSDDGHAVPYKRFKSVIETKNSLKSKNSELQRQLEELKAQLDTKGPRTKVEAEEEVDPLDSLFDVNIDDVDSPGDSRYESLEQRLRTFEERQAQADLEAELRSVKTNYPSVPESVLLQAVVQNPNANLNQVAATYDQWVAEIQESAIADYHERQRASAPRRPSATGASGPSKQAKPRNMKDARAGALAFWKEQMGHQ